MTTPVFLVRCQGGCRRRFPAEELFLVGTADGALIACHRCISAALAAIATPAPVFEPAQ